MRVLIALLLGSLGASAQAEPPGPVVFSEIMWMGSAASSSDEWIELYNRGDTRVDVAGWTVTRLTQEGEEVMVQIEAGSLDPQATFLIANFAADDSRSHLAVVPQLVDSGLALANTKLQLRLYAGDPENGGALVDVADDGTGAPFAGDNSLKQAMVRVAMDQDGALSESWATAQEASGWDAGASERGTPGQIPTHLRPAEPSGQSGTTQIQPAAWAALKTRFARK